MPQIPGSSRPQVVSGTDITSLQNHIPASRRQASPARTVSELQTKQEPFFLHPVALAGPSGSRADVRFTYENANATRAPLTTMKSRMFHRSRK